MQKRILIMFVAAVLLLSACKGNYSSGEKVLSANADSASTSADTVAGKPKLVKTAEMQFKVKNVLKASEAVTALTSQYDGMVMNNHLQTTVDNSEEVRLSNDSVMQISAFITTAEMTVKIPQQHLSEFMNQVSHMSIQVNMMKVDVEDRTIDYLSARMKTQNRTDMIAYRQQAKVTDKNADGILALKDDKADRQISNLKTDDEVKYSTLNLIFSQNAGINKQVAANTDLSAYNLSIPSRLWLAVSNGWLMVTEVIVLIANLWAFLLLAVLGWLSFGYYKKRQLNKPAPNI